jgi:hypothetical protein
MSTIDRLLSNYSRQVRLPWSPNVSGKQRIWFAVYPPAEERRVRARLPQFEALTLEPVSQMPQEDQHATELNHPEKVSRVTFPRLLIRRKFFSEQPLNLPIAAGSGAAAAHPGFAFGGDGWGQSSRCHVRAATAHPTYRCRRHDLRSCVSARRLRDAGAACLRPGWTHSAKRL